MPEERVGEDDRQIDRFVALEVREDGLDRVLPGVAAPERGAGSGGAGGDAGGRCERRLVPILIRLRLIQVWLVGGREVLIPWGGVIAAAAGRAGFGDGGGVAVGHIVPSRSGRL